MKKMRFITILSIPFETCVKASKFDPGRLDVSFLVEDEELGQSLRVLKMKLMDVCEQIDELVIKTERRSENTMSTKVDALAAVAIAVGKAIEAKETREDFLEAVKVAFAEPEESLVKKVAEDRTTGSELVAIVTREAGIELPDVLETVDDVWRETEEAQKAGGEKEDSPEGG